MSDIRDLQRVEYDRQHVHVDVGNMARAIEALTDTVGAIRLGSYYFADDTFIRIARATYQAGLDLVNVLGKAEDYFAMNRIALKTQLVREACEAALGVLTLKGYVKGYKGWA